MLKKMISFVAVAGLVLALAGAVQAEDITWNVGNGVWDTTTANWTGTTGFFVDGVDNVTFDDSVGGGWTTVDISVADVAPTGVTFNNSAATYALTGTNGITGATGLTKSGDGELIVRNVNSYTGKTSVLAGTLTLGTGVYLSNAGVAGPLGAPTGAEATIDLYNGTALQMGSTQPRENQVTDRTIKLAGDGEGTVSIRANDNDTIFTFGAVTTTGTGAKTLALFTGYSGNGDRESMIFNGELSESLDSPLSLQVTFRTQSGSQSYVSLDAGGAFTGPITLVKGPNVNSGYLTIGGVRTKDGGTTIPGSGQLGGGDYAGNISLDTNTILNYYSSANQILAGEISGDGALTMAGSGALTLTGANTYAGGTVVNDGTLTIDGSLADSTMTIDGGLVDGSGALNFNIDGLTTSGLIDMNGGALDISGLNIVINEAGAGLTEAAYVLVDYADGGTLSGTEFAGVIGDARYIIDYNHLGNGNQIALVLASQTWDETENAWYSEHWRNNGVGPGVFPGATRAMTVNYGIVTVSSDVGAAPGAPYSLDIASDDVGGTVTVGSGGTLPVTVGVSVGANGTLNVNAGGSLSADVDVTIASGGNLTVAGALNTPILNTAGTTTLTGAAGAIGTVNATGGTLNTAGTTVVNLNVDGATVNTTGPAGATDLQMNSGQMNLTGGNMAVATATFTDGGINASANALVVSDTVTLVGGTTIANTVGTDFQMVGNNLVTPTAENHREVRINGGGTVTLQAPPAVGAITTNMSIEHSSPAEVPDPATLVGPVGGLGETWNQFSTSSASALVDSAGEVTSVGYASNLGGPDKWGFGSSNLSMIWSGLRNFDTSPTNSQRFVINGLTSGVLYNVWLASANINDGQRSSGDWWTPNTTTTVGPQTADNTAGVNGATWEEGNNYVLFENVEPDGNGEIVFDGHSNDKTVTGFEPRLPLNGFQLVALVPHVSEGNLNLPFTEVNATATSTVAIPLEVGGTVTLGGMTTAPGATLTVDSPATDITLTNMTLGGGSKVLSTVAEAGGGDVTITLGGALGGTLSGGDGVASLGEFWGAGSWTHLTLAADSTYEQTFTFDGLSSELNGESVDMVEGNRIDVWGSLTLGDDVTIRLVDNGGSADGEDVVLFRAAAGIDISTYSIELPDDWSSGGLRVDAPNGLLILQNLVTVTGPLPGDANNNGTVGDADWVIFKAQFGGAPGGVNDDADFNDDGRVDLRDLAILDAAWDGGVGAPEMDATVTPEPATMSLLAIGGLLVLRRRRRKA